MRAACEPTSTSSSGVPSKRISRPLAGGRKHRFEVAQQGGLPAAGFAAHDDELALPDGQIDPPQGGEGASG